MEDSGNHDARKVSDTYDLSKWLIDNPVISIESATKAIVSAATELL